MLPDDNQQSNGEDQSTEEPYMQSQHLAHNDKMIAAQHSSESKNLHDNPQLIAAHHSIDSNNLNHALQPDWSFLEKGILFGRQTELKILQDAFLKHQAAPQESAISKQRELIIVSGKSGTGKSALVKQAYEGLLKRHNGYFAMGKFDQLHKFQRVSAEPYGPLVAALTQIAVAMTEADQKVTGKNDKKLGPKAQRVLDEVGTEYCHLLGKLVPHIARLLKLSNAQLQEGQFRQDTQQDRVKAAFLKLFHAIEQPIVLVVDDLQWADERSLDLLESLIGMERTDNSPGGHNLTVVGICRSNEVPWEHTFAGMLRRLEDEKDMKILHVVVQNLPVEATNLMLAHILDQPKETCLPLAEVLHAKSDQGNVLFSIQLLQAMIEEKILTASLLPSFGFNEDPTQQWLFDGQKWDDLLAKMGAKLDVVQLVSNHIQKLPLPCQELMKTISCIGAEVDFDVLVLAPFMDKLDDNENDGTTAVMDVLQRAIEERMVVEQLPHRPGRYAFAHDRVQQASYSLIPETKKTGIHLAIGRVLLHKLSAEELDRHLFLVVNQLIHGVPLLHNSADRVGVADLCVTAGKKAAKQADFGAAQMYFGIAADLLPPRHWRDEYHLSLELFCSRAEAEYCAAEFSAMDATLDGVLANARTSHDKTRAQLTRIYGLGIQGKFQEAIDLGVSLMCSLGEKIPAKPSLLTLGNELLKVKWRLRSLSDDDIYNLPTIDIYDKEKTTIMSILRSMVIYSFCGSPDVLFPFVALYGVKWTLKHGLSPMSGTALVSYSVLLCALGDYSAGNRFAKLGIKLLDRFPHSETQVLPTLYCLAYGLVIPWKTPMAETLPPLQHAVDVALDSGDFDSASYTLYTMIHSAWIAGDQLQSYGNRISQALSFMSDQGPWLALTNLEQQMLDNFTGRSANPLHIVMEMDAANNSKNDFHLYQCCVLAVKLQLAYHFGDIDLAMDCVKKMWKLVDTVTASNYTALYFLYDGMACLETAYSLKGIRRRTYIRCAKGRLKKLKHFAKFCPENFLHKVYLLRGELCVLSGKLGKALEWYAVAIDSAAAAGVPQLHALAHERAAVAYERLGGTSRHAENAQKHVEEAVSLYGDWGATALVAHLRDKYSHDSVTGESVSVDGSSNKKRPQSGVPGKKDQAKDHIYRVRLTRCVSISASM